MKNILLIILSGIIIFLCNIPLTAKENTRAAILDFTSENTPETYARSVRNLFEVSLYKTGNFDILERNKIESILKEQGFQMSGCIDTSCAVEIGRLLSANIVVIGSLNKISKYIIAVKFIDIAEGKIKLADSETAATEDDIQNAVDTLAGRMAGNLSDGGKQPEAAKIFREKPDIKKPEEKAAGAPAAVSYIISLAGSYHVPQGDFSDLAEYGYGMNLMLGVRNLGLERLILGIEAGYSYFPGGKKNVEYCSIMPALGIAGYLYELSSFYISPVIGIGAGYNTISFDRDGLDINGQAEYTAETSIQLTAKAGLNIGHKFKNNMAAQAGAHYINIFEKDNKINWLEISAGISYNF